MTILVFKAKWCGPCKSYTPILEELKIQHPEVVVSVIDVDDNKDEVNKYNVMGVPTTILLDDDGNTIFNKTGLMSLSCLKQSISDAI